MARTTEDAVKLLLLADYDSQVNPSLIPFIDSASALVDSAVVCAKAKNQPLDTDRQEIIERWLAAHAYTCSDPTYREKQTQSARGVFMGSSGMALQSSRYGQMAMMLDPSGCVASLSNQNQGQAFWLGTRPSEATDYIDRR